jgi:hypothetical protein
VVIGLPELKFKYGSTWHLREPQFAKWDGAIHEQTVTVRHLVAGVRMGGL